MMMMIKITVIIIIITTIIYIALNHYLLLALNSNKDIVFTILYYSNISLHYITINCIALHRITLRYVILSYVTLRYITLRYIMSCYVTLRYILPHYTVQQITITYDYLFINICVQRRAQVSGLMPSCIEEFRTYGRRTVLVSQLHATST